ncbi:hypothetical protein Pmar_PMAR003909 [Perkinsus marinus ATCC 50983]|uniref:Uncharacterized protein n=1 Tax=Perkinsus marinus (strain ATCC 50983 / TXsc) TaxID=423536 RepID=C5KW87_PERM5|nr:hypothetical protein Pmar_PMAR003909 [Perkinsus marinus ATCC 50983]EER11256.1 hypothetical protein Pmar_PMAR003909 [Perkinsus marinus ATCC 50983]|eukprot:XP_002779461.1 hypothetical protein Pmar_PMAR003909 [Perkinsus marinus ATCC 50983]
MLTGIGALMGLVKPGLWVDAYWLQWWSPRTSSKLSSYGSDRFAWKQPGVAACETMCVRVPQVPCKRVIDAIGSAGAIPVDHLASYIEMKTIERSSWSYMALDKLAHRVVLVMKCLGVLVMMYATVPTQEGHLPCIGPVSVYTCGIVSMAWASGRGGVWLGVLGTWFKVPTSLTGEWPVDDYVLVLAITTLLSPSGLPAALTFPTTPEWVVSSLALPSLFPEVGIQALWLYLLGSILGNLLLCREMQGQAGVAAVLGYMLGNKLMNVGQVVHEVFTPRAKKAILGGGIWLKSCALVVLAGIVCSAPLEGLGCPPVSFKSLFPFIIIITITIIIIIIIVVVVVAECSV